MATCPDTGPALLPANTPVTGPVRAAPSAPRRSLPVTTLPIAALPGNTPDSNALPVSAAACGPSSTMATVSVLGRVMLPTVSVRVMTKLSLSAAPAFVKV